LADGCIAGSVAPTADVLRAALWAIGLADGITAVTSAMYHGLPNGRVLTYTDIAVIPVPTPEQMAAAAVAAAADRRALVGDEPVVAFLSYSTHGSAAGPEVDRVRAAVEIFRALAPDVPADGELQADAALDAWVAARKCPASPVGGRANILVFPSLEAGNIAYKLTERLAGASAAGPLLQGLARPMSDLSRGATPDDIVDVAAMVVLQATLRMHSTQGAGTDGVH
jgi:phosphate acetyltransferase